MDAQNPIRVLIVDDHAMLRKGLAAFLMSYGDLKLVGEAANGAEALELCGKLRPDIILMDLMMPIMGGITATRLIHEQYAEIQIIVLTSFGEEQLIKDVLEAGAISYLFKKVSAENLAKAIRAAHDGFSTFAPEVTEILVRSIQQPHSAFQGLTPREREVLALMIKGLGNNEISEALMISGSTTKSHVSSILAKLGADNRIEVITMMLEHSINLGAFYVK
jgi:two-component system, NarL family, response regulator LiaR